MDKVRFFSTTNNHITSVFKDLSVTSTLDFEKRVEFMLKDLPPISIYKREEYREYDLETIRHELLTEYVSETAIVNGKAVAIFGLGYADNDFWVWLITTNKALDMKFKLFRGAKRYLANTIKDVGSVKTRTINGDRLTNRWLESLGFEDTNENSEYRVMELTS